jgi:hypothetical protein
VRRLFCVLALCVAPLAGCIVPSAVRTTDPCPYAATIRQEWPQDADWAIRIAWRESRCQPDARNPSGAVGLFQLLGHWDLLAKACLDADPYLAECNARAAWYLYSSAGRAPWN